MEAFLKELQHLKIQLETIKLATCNFDEKFFIGKGGFGMVYQGVLTHSKGKSMVAFKRLDRNNGQGDPEFLKEIIMLSRYSHENLISLLGFCDEDGEKILVYEHASHGSLDLHLGATNLTWRQRIGICLGAAKGLSYLHDPKGTQQRIIHRDVKSSNILLDENWNAKISDLGLSKIGPANQPHSFLATNVVGTFGYIDPLYLDTYSLTKESDTYSFGVVLFEVLCGRLCYMCNNYHRQSLVQMWKQVYVEKKLDEIIFQDMKQNMDCRSLEVFSEIAYRCLKKDREARPQMSHVVEQLEIALRFQEKFEGVEPPTDYEEMIKSAVPPLVYGSKEELTMLLSKGILLNDGKTWFSLNKSGEHCEMISAAECVVPTRSSSIKFAHYGPNRSRFSADYNKCVNFCYEFETHVRTQFLSPHITYAVNLVFDLDHDRLDHLSINYRLAGETKSSTLYFIDQREDGWFMAELYQFTSDSANFDLEIVFHSWKPLLLEGIEFQPVESVCEQVEHQVLEDDEVDMQTTSHPDTYWDQKLPSDYEGIIELSQYKLEWKTKKDLYSILCKGFPVINYSNGKEWFSLAKNGKKCHMLPARVVLRNEEWKWRPLPKSRFEEEAFDPHCRFWIYCRSKMLSPQTRYASYLVYKLQKYHSKFEAPIKVNFSADPNCSWYIYLLNPQTPIIGRKVYEKTHNPLNRPRMRGLSQQRNDGWMEVQLLEFQTGASTEWISQYLELTSFCNNCLKGLIVQGIEFKPILDIHTQNLL